MHKPDKGRIYKRSCIGFGELIFRQVEWRSNALKHLPYKLRYASALCNMSCGIKLAKVGGSMSKQVKLWKVPKCGMHMIRRRSKLPMVRMSLRLTNSRMHGSKCAGAEMPCSGYGSVWG